MIKITLKVLGQKFEAEVQRGTTYADAVSTLENVARASSPRNANISFSDMDLFHTGSGKVKDVHVSISGEEVELTAVKSKHESANK